MTAEDRITAAEWAIGLLDGVDAPNASTRATTDPAFAQEVDWWQQRLAPLYAQGDDVSPPPYLRDRVEARLDLAILGERRGRSGWRLLGLGSALGALAASVVAWMITPAAPVERVSPPRTAIAARPLVASLLPTAGATQPPVTILLIPDTAQLRLSKEIDTPGNRSAQLWRIPADGTPVSLGVLAGKPDRSLRLRKADVPRTGDQLAVSIEPLGGSPTGQPTGPVVFAGTVAVI